MYTHTHTHTHTHIYIYIYNLWGVGSRDVIGSKLECDFVVYMILKANSLWVNLFFKRIVWSSYIFKQLNGNNSLEHQSFICIWLNFSKYSILTLIILFIINHLLQSPVGYGFRIHQTVYLQKGKTSTQRVSGCDTKPSDGEVPVMLEGSGNAEYPFITCWSTLVRSGELLIWSYLWVK